MKASRRFLHLTLVILLELPVAFRQHPANANSAITINTDGSLSPADAPIARNGDIYTLTKNINETIIIQRNNTVLDAQHYSIYGNMGSQGILLSNIKNVTVKNARVSSFSTGIKVSHSTENAAVNISVTDCTYGILTEQSPKTKIANNTVQNNKWDGILITASPNSQITNNKVQSNGKWGIYLGHSSNCTLRNNKMTSNKYNFGVSVDFLQDIDTSNAINGHPIIYWIDQQDRQVPADASYVAIVNSNNIHASNLLLTQNGQGITFINSVNNLVENCNISGNAYYGIALIDCVYSTINNNTITRNEGGGITVASSAMTSVTNNTIENNYTGIYLQASNENSVHHNNFINNTRQAISENSINTWDDGYPSGGNYWSNYKGEDTNNDGIGDLPYIINKDNQDHYPLTSTVKSMPNISQSPSTPTTTLLIATLVIVAVGVALYALRKRGTHSAKKPSLA